MTTVIILGMHRSRTSMIAHVCQKLGVHVGDRLLGSHPSQPKGHFEDVEFYQLNQVILQGCGGKWDDPPDIRVVERNANRFRKQAQQLIQSKSHRRLWGWKDPRTCLTLPVYWPFVDNPRIIFVTRNTSGIIRSLMRRSGGDAKKWHRVIESYHRGMTWAAERGIASLELDTDAIVQSRRIARMHVESLSKFVGGNGKVDAAMGVIEFR